MLLLSALAATTADTRPWVVVTGASSGIGRSLSLEFAARGSNVAVVARRRGALNDLCSEVDVTFGVACLPVRVDLSAPGGAVRLERATRRLPRLQVLVANAGMPWAGAAVSQPLDSLTSLIELNVGQHALLCRLFGARFAAQGHGGLLLTSSLTAYASLPQAAAYAASRSFVASLAGSLRRELAPSGVAVTCLLPGATETEFASRASIERAMIFNFPFARAAGLVLAPTAVARVGVDALAAGRATAIPGFLNAAYRTQASLMPAGLAADFAAACFGADTPLASPLALLRALPTLVPAAAFLVVAIPIEVLRLPLDWLCRPPLPWLPTPPRWPAIDAAGRSTSAMGVADCARAALLLLCATLACLIGLNIRQNGRASHPPPAQRVTSAAEARSLRTKADFVAVWRAATPPALADVGGKDFDGELIGLGVLAPVSGLITHELFGPGGPWLGKAFGARRVPGPDGECSVGTNRFAPARGGGGGQARQQTGGGSNGGGGAPHEQAEAEEERRLQQFVARLDASALDGQPALILDYAAAGTPIWGRLVGMRDELRQVAPGVLLGLGSMWATGGAANCAPFLLIERKDEPAAASSPRKDEPAAASSPRKDEPAAASSPRKDEPAAASSPRKDEPAAASSPRPTRLVRDTLGVAQGVADKVSKAAGEAAGSALRVADKAKPAMSRAATGLGEAVEAAGVVVREKAQALSRSASPRSQPESPVSATREANAETSAK